MIRLILICLIALMSSCSWKSLAPTIGGGVGAGVGSIGGIPGAVAGGTLGAGAGQLVKELDANDKAQQTISALSQGDVQKLVEIGLEEQKGWFSQTLENLYKFLGIIIVCIGLFFMCDIWWTRHLSKKLKLKENE